jgi:hypothetical protein
MKTTKNHPKKLTNSAWTVAGLLLLAALLRPATSSISSSWPFLEKTTAEKTGGRFGKKEPGVWVGGEGGN